MTASERVGAVMAGVVVVVAIAVFSINAGVGLLLTAVAVVIGGWLGRRVAARH